MFYSRIIIRYVRDMQYLEKQGDETSISSQNRIDLINSNIY
jgi:hypothetical protein